ncbi:MAG TPA: hypothetical protein DCS29_04945 [Candidatus Magasanikbacteria bacterium]|nr:MAG: hypothetical protein A2479_04765 [Candidatus Magasanikbacteria bacterium RIFOXYC2_FULL_39_8]HAT04080.1 hypothetical protein [Candidatus Magasanikbacteria bacterium]
MLISTIDLISRSAKLYRDNLKTLATYAGILLIPALLLMFAGYTLGILIFLTQNFLLGLGLYFILVILLSLVGFIISMSLIRVIASLYQKQSAPNLVINLKQSLSLLWPAVLVSLISGLAIFGGFLLLVIPGIIFAIWFIFSIHALLLDNKLGTDALRFSKQLVAGRWGSVFWRLAAVSILLAILIGILQWIIKMIFGIDNAQIQTQLTLKTGLYGLFTIILSTFLSPLTTAIPTILYLELKNTPLDIRIPEKTIETEPPTEEK